MSQVCENEQPHIFRLPAELRNVIYEDVLGDLGNKFACFGGLTYVLKDGTSLSLWFVNRQMYQETRLLPYSLNSITAGPLVKFEEWQVQRTQEQLRAISRLHFVFDSFFFGTSADLLDTLPDFGYSPLNSLAMNSLLTQQLAFPELTGLKHVRLELRSHAREFIELVEQIEFLQEAKVQIERLNPRAGGIVELNCQGDRLVRADIPASSTTGLRIVRFDKLWEGAGRSAHDIVSRKGLAQSTFVVHAETRKANLRDIWEERNKLELLLDSGQTSALLNFCYAL